jgi:hypothetical protein
MSLVFGPRMPFGDAEKNQSACGGWGEEENNGPWGNATGGQWNDEAASYQQWGGEAMDNAHGATEPAPHETETHHYITQLRLNFRSMFEGNRRFYSVPRERRSSFK